MIYNLLQYLITNLPLINFIANGWNPDSDQDAIMISETGGDPKHFYDRTDWAVQVLSRAKNVEIAKENIDSVYILLKNKFGLVLPEIAVGGITYPQMIAYQVSPVQSPSYLGATPEHLEMFSFNLIIVTT